MSLLSSFKNTIYMLTTVYKSLCACIFGAIKSECSVNSTLWVQYAFNLPALFVLQEQLVQTFVFSFMMSIGRHYVHVQCSIFGFHSYNDDDSTLMNFMKAFVSLSSLHLNTTHSMELHSFSSYRLLLAQRLVSQTRWKK